MEWFTCDGTRDTARRKGSVCLYSEQSMRRLKSNPCRCVKHGALLTYAIQAPTRVEAKLELGLYVRKGDH